LVLLSDTGLGFLRDHNEDPEVIMSHGLKTYFNGIRR
jgi:hypothetical protein